MNIVKGECYKWWQILSRPIWASNYKYYCMTRKIMFSISVGSLYIFWKLLICTSVNIYCTIGNIYTRLVKRIENRNISFYVSLLIDVKNEMSFIKKQFYSYKGIYIYMRFVQTSVSTLIKRLVVSACIWIDKNVYR